MVILEDVLDKRLYVVFCGTAAGNESAIKKVYYADPRNKFWRVINMIGLTDRKLVPSEFRLLLNYKIGLTDLAKNIIGSDKTIDAANYDIIGFKAKIIRFAPMIIAFNGKKSGKAFFGIKIINYGIQPEKIGQSTVFILPSTSGAAGRYWDINHWQAMANYLKSKY
jgi:double-stranded uracil-DNA glycosylase